MKNPIDLIASLGVVPVIAIERASDAVALADALLEGGLPVAEITFRTEAAAEVMAALRDARPELCIGAGTVLDKPNLKRAIDAGARFGLAPGFDPEIVDAAKDAGLPFCPGIMTPSDLTLASARGVKLAKFFPAGVAGGPKALSGIAAPFAHLGIRFIPTGGVTEATIGEWLAIKQVIAVGGTWIAKTEDIRDGRFADIARNAAAAVKVAKEALEKRA
ncbi:MULTISPECIES: bifunctional 4-hydroxy-2-oxoglutarate aldolase/2-dehydro-3-deoxy-phosphogluconate aldolase [unclassified Rhizobium]|uniref:bifunctional 4-hydroxy-2-oxoglutarate aldolase/2-dehydro-3-deoxy-phosphogluconate aldolase n=1 Tax=unclassified Rhizobium TaxID=2613769 RepID=UPI0016205029|nr:MULTISPECIES: bifunctional 4-hydroxy-2-oxoglutarate aldolase/2-dehydro-3-deoxy-phosphogluconate aldolase [unclassified Rhizobium]MBB3319999.1 2-dehydro-3-deoxyphosphogluconate aldolase/(4S)-4-hydroxy-2-oxoglutarate aldolase [Rhizobium sp. BK181]MBB3545039.1 2-dehydro-3-deoxyphosphogluconate aldolase/(4S)-4-hydroxy-2-oxoglutarate aldolase [Rhizobium sp. BK399]MCS3743743.1 2-dehydro-3-deoxyphosphogluconate aldolase/(4S)-4-hydroxy-2-oxoglutarate aldolase [Rhizobium sp. BK661]MCS4095710.1 2-dehy